MFQNPKILWVIGAVIAVVCKGIDDLPEPRYNTFHDPWAAALLSIILANSITVILRRNRIIWAAVLFFPALVLKFFIQPLFWVHNALAWDTATLFAVHTILGFLASRNLPGPVRFQCAVVAAAGVIAALILATILCGGVSSWTDEYYQLSLARILSPLAFWLAVLRVENEDKKMRLPRNN